MLDKAVKLSESIHTVKLIIHYFLPYYNIVILFCGRQAREALAQAGLWQKIADSITTK